jgi:hypothetical protein
MLKKTMIILSAVLVALAINGCAWGRYDNNYKTLDDMTRHFVNSDLNVDVVKPVMPFFGAQGGCSLLIDGTEIGIYKYEVISGAAAKKAKIKLNDIYKKDYVYIEGLKYPVLLNGTFMLIGYETNKSRNKIIEVFLSFE